MSIEPQTLRPGTPRPGVPQWKTGKPDSLLAAAVDVARRELEAVTGADTIGEHLGARREEDRVVTHLFESRLRGYRGWHWFAVLTRNSRSKTVTVSEVGLLPGEDSVLAPPWVPWSERVRPEDVAALEAVQAAEAAETHDDDAAPASDGEPSDEPATEEETAADAAAEASPLEEDGFPEEAAVAGHIDEAESPGE